MFARRELYFVTRVLAKRGRKALEEYSRKMRFVANAGNGARH